MLTATSEDIGGLIVCQRCKHSGYYLKADVRNAEREREFRSRLACSSCGASDFTLVPKQEIWPVSEMSMIPQRAMGR